VLYVLVLFPLFSPLFGVLIVRYAPLSQRYINVTLWSFLMLFITLTLWGFFYGLGRLAIGGLVIPELGVIVPLALLSGFSIYQYMRSR
jgi:lipopolysaccharide export system permease protein